MTIQEQIEESCLMAADSISEEAKDQGTKTIMDLFKSAILKKYKVAFDHEITQGEVHKKNVDKTVDSFFSDMCVAIRQFTTMSDDYKDQLIQTAKYQLAPIKEMVFQILVNKGVQIIWPYSPSNCIRSIITICSISRFCGNSKISTKY